jgi:integrase
LGAAVANIRQRNGKWQVQVRRQGYAPRVKSFRTKVDAERWGREQESLIDRGLQADPADLRRTTVRDLVERFEKECLPERKGRRREAVFIAAMRREEWMLRRLDQDVAGALRAWAQKRQAAVSAATVVRELNLVSTIFSTAMRVWATPLSVNPVTLVKRPVVDKAPKGRVWSAEDFNRMRAAADRLRGSGAVQADGSLPGADKVVALDYVVPALELSIETAMRRGELCSFTADNVHLDELRIWLPPEITKTGVGRDVLLSPRAVEIVRGLLAMPRGKDPRVIPVNPDTLGIRFREVRAAAGLEGLRLHDGRHTAATRASGVFTNVLELAAFTGHRSLATLKKYYHPNATELAKRLS